ncbi:protein-methionine-sulfoxide reductase heme-binding subunit MsrQ [Thalassobaculum sp. OXR-137]|uniref:sulfite oxidase heme-binding subunit YedZ n=1 Tax=Thalassobaculum sp. OXR-137 TaxID=3100173 RepID=UPI002AC8C2E3|nr:protein-methionine-sulfoxide reductase heme-binding subunit MsrQ [Thalassobaculum sp. OXR-137]WPZ33365.1 protein-methionine-sulfoxide reductase heme-binding subunit MsrQ [Thalassobaculum sp. OXR-137]
MALWHDRAGRVSGLKIATLVAVSVPALLLAVDTLLGGLGPRPYDEAIHRSGDWAIRILVVSLAVTPAIRILTYPRLISIRRMLGVSALFYLLLHFGLYIADQGFDMGKVASEIVLRTYLTIGFVALAIMAALGATSFDGMVRRLGRRWNQLHKLVYLAALLAAVHFFMQTKIQAFEASLIAGFLLTLGLYRLAAKRRLALTSPLVLAGIAVLGGLLTAGAEGLWFWVGTSVPPLRVLEANLMLPDTIRPAWWVLAAGLAVAVLPVLRKALKGGAEAGIRRTA